MRHSTFFNRAVASRARVERPALMYLPDNRTYKRDKRGRFGSGSGGVRDELAGAEGVGAINAAASAEAKRITGRDVEFGLDGDPQIAREHAEGALKGMERYPGVRVVGVKSADLPEDVYGRTLSPSDRSGYVIMVSRDSQRYGAEGYRGDLRNSEMERSIVAGTPQGVALHEFGHAAANQYDLNGWANNRANQYAEIDMNTTDTQKAVSKAISRRAAENNQELSAEAFADVMVNGSSSSGMSRLIVETFDTNIRIDDAGDE